FKCHGPDEQQRKSRLRLDDRAMATQPAKSGARAIVPGKETESELVRRILSFDPDEMMPPPASKKQLTADQKETLRRWIAAGAEYKQHWAFVAPKRPPVPQIALRLPQIKNPVDAFILARLDEQNLTPSPPAEPATLIRRVTLDLTGLQ